MKSRVRKSLFKTAAMFMVAAVFKLLFSFSAISAIESSTDLDVEIVRERVIANLMRVGVNEESIHQILTTITSGGYWPGIDYEDVSRTGFDQTAHLSNMVVMARAYKKPGNRFTGNPGLINAIHSALDFWLEHDFICDNWWHNQIGTPRMIIDLLLIMDTELTEKQLEEALVIAGRANMQASGARQSGDRILMAALWGKQGAFMRNADILDEVVEIMGSDIKIITDGPGIKPDLSYHHRKDNVVSTLTYGLNPPGYFSTWALKFNGTRFSLSRPAMELLVDYFLDGVCRSMVYGRYSDPGVQNREISRTGILNAHGPALVEALYQSSHYRRDELQTIARIRREEIDPELRYTSFFWHSEYFIHQRPGWYASVRMYAERNNNIDAPHNNEGLLNHHFADGSNFLSRSAEEYVNIFPVWDWQRVPGTTVVQKPELPHWNQIVRRGPSGFVGGVTDDEFGAAVFDFISPHDPLKARKAWFFFDDEYVSLGSGINSSSDFPVNTTVSQIYLRHDVISGDGSRASTLNKGEHSLDGITWVYHDSVGYIFPSQQQVKLKNAGSSGNWRRINHTHWATEDEIRADLFTLWFDHGVKPLDKSYEYIVVPGIGAASLDSYSKEPPVKILSNTPSLQAVSHDNLGITQVVFYEAGEIVLGNGISLAADKSCMVMVRSKGQRIRSITVSDPSRGHQSLELTFGTRVRGGGFNFSTGWNRLEGSSVVAVDLPKDEFAGMSMTLSVR